MEVNFVLEIKAGYILIYCKIMFNITEQNTAVIWLNISIGTYILLFNFYMFSFLKAYVLNLGLFQDESPPIPEGLSPEITDFLRLCFKKVILLHTFFIAVLAWTKKLHISNPHIMSCNEPNCYHQNHLRAKCCGSF